MDLSGQMTEGLAHQLSALADIRLITAMAAMA